MRISCLLLTTVMLACGAAAGAADTPKPAAKPAAAAGAKDAFWARFDQALASDRRAESDRARDVYRHPRETLQFFGLKAGQNVVEITPGGGWYTELLAPTMKGQGTLSAAIIAPDSASSEGAKKYYADSNKKLRDKLAAAPDVYGEVKVIEFEQAKPSFGADSADLILTFRNVHNWTSAKSDAAMFRAFFAALKPGGTLGVVEHRAKAGVSIDESFKSGYIPEDYVIKLATDAGFKLAARSEINANPKDTKDYAEGVWTLPPTLRLKDKDREKYLAIGESDRMTLKFVKE